MLPGAVVVALLSQLSQQCGAALVRVRDKVSRATPSHVSEGDAQSFLACRAGVRVAQCAGPGARVLRQTCGVQPKSRSRTDSRPSHQGAAEKMREKQIPILGGARAKP